MSGSLLSTGDTRWTQPTGLCTLGTHDLTGETDKSNVNKYSCYWKKMGCWHRDRKRDLLRKEVTFQLRPERGAEKEYSRQRDLHGSRIEAGRSLIGSKNWKKKSHLMILALTSSCYSTLILCHLPTSIQPKWTSQVGLQTHPDLSYLNLHTYPCHCLERSSLPTTHFHLAIPTHVSDLSWISLLQDIFTGLRPGQALSQSSL